MGLERIFSALLCAAVAAFPLSDGETGPARLERQNLDLLRVATFNLLNLFDNSDDPYRDDEGTNPKSIEELRVLARTIDQLQADVIGVQEVENREVLEALNRHLERPFPFVELLEGNDGRGIDVGILSRLEIESAASHRLTRLQNGGSFSRDLALFRLVASGGKHFDVGVVHLKSKLGDRKVSDRQRESECLAIRSILERRLAVSPDVPVVLLGDFNDTKDAATLRPLVSWLRDPIADLVAEESRYTYVYQGNREQIDHILTSQSLRAASAGIVHLDNSGSDHAPILVDLDLGVRPARVDPPPSEGWPKIARPSLRADDLEALENHLLEEIEIQGKVSKVHRPSASAAILNFHEDYKRAVTVYIPADAFPRLPDLDSLVGKSVIVRGPVCRRGPLGEGVYSIRVTQSAQMTGR